MVPKFYFMYSTATLENMDCLNSERKNLMSFQFPTNSPICTLADCHIAKSSWIKLPSFSKPHEYKALCGCKLTALICPDCLYVHVYFTYRLIDIFSRLYLSTTRHSVSLYVYASFFVS